MQNRFQPIIRFITLTNAQCQKYWLFILIFALTGLSVWTGYHFAWATEPYGIGVRSDSVAYFWSAHNLVNGIGLGRITANGDFKPMTHWPPLYPMALSLFEMVGIPALNGARWLGVFLSGTIVFLTGLNIARFTRSFWFSFLGAFILSVCPAFWETGLYAMTEPLYLFFSLSAFLLLDQFLSSGRWKWLFACGLISACCFLTRYVGFTLIGVFVAVIFFQKQWPLQQRLRRALVFGGISIFPILLWMIRNAIQAGTPTNRSLQYYPVSYADFQLAWQTFSGWFEANQAIFQIGTGKILVILAGLLLFFVYKRTSETVHQVNNKPWIPICAAFYVVLYSLGVLGSRLFMDPLITFFEQRIIFLIYIPLLFTIIFILHWFFKKAQERSIYMGAVVLVFVMLVTYSYILVYQTKYQHFINDSHERGLDYSDKSLKSSCLISGLKDVPSDYWFYTDNIERLYFFTQRNSDQINADERVLQLSQEQSDHGLVFVIFNRSEIPDMVKKQFQNQRQVCEAPMIEVIPPHSP
jgi:4-amino-4-deoxy-L-arabinose transferase-like glycosyltransferase